MSISGIDTTTTTKSDAAQNKLAKDLNSFLTLLTTQLSHQDPLSPMDSTEFTNQLVQFANVEQNIYTNKNLESLISLQEATQQMAAVNYIGMNVEAESNSLPLQDGAAYFSYKLPADASQNIISITNSSGNIVKTVTGETKAGTYKLAWDGKDSAGNQLDDGVYTLNFTTMAADDKSDPTPTVWTRGWVTNVKSEDGTVMLSRSGSNVDANKVTSIGTAE